MPKSIHSTTIKTRKHQLIASEKSHEGSSEGLEG